MQGHKVLKNLPLAIFTHSPVVASTIRNLIPEADKAIIIDFNDLGNTEKIDFSEETKQLWWIDDVKHVTVKNAKKFVKIQQQRSILSTAVFHQPFVGLDVKERTLGEQLFQVVQFLEQASPYTSILLYKGIWQEGFFAFPQQHSGTSLQEIIKTALSVADTPRGGKRKLLVDHSVNFTGIEFLSEFPQKVFMGVSNKSPSVLQTIGERTILKPSSKGSTLPKPNKPEVRKKTSETPEEELQESHSTERLIVKTKHFVATKTVVIPPPVQPQIHRSKVVLSHVSEKPVEEYAQWKKIGVTQDKKQTRAPITFVHSTQDFEKKFNSLFTQTVRPVEVDQDQLSAKIESLHKPKTFRKKIAKKVRKKKRVFLVSVVIFVLLALNIAVYVGANFWAKQSFIFFAEHLQVTSEKSWREQSFQVSTAILRLYQPVTQVVLGEESDLKTQHLIDASNSMIDFFMTHRKTTLLLRQSTMKVIGSQEGDVFEGLSSFPSLAEDSYKKLATLESIVKNPDYEELLFGEQRMRSIERLTELRKNLRLQQEIVQILPTLLAKESRKTYAVFLQDLQESRPSGGKLVALALITFENGKVINTQSVGLSEFNDLDEVISPPSSLQKYLNTEHWQLRDGNWEVDFTQAGEHMMWHLEKGVSQPIDGVMTIHSVSFKNLIMALGGISVPSSGEVIDGKNFLEKIRFFTFQNRSNPEEKFIEYYESFLSEMKKVDEEKMEVLLSALYTELSEHEIQVTFKDPILKNFSSMLGWSGEILSPNCPSQIVQATCVVSTFYETKTNVAQNKISSEIEKNSTFNITFRPNKIYYNYDFSYKTVSNYINWPGGVAQELIRIYIPKNVENIQVEIEKQFLTEEEFTIIEKGEFKEVSYVITVAPESEIKGKMTYEQPALPLPFSYSFFVQKQPGEVATPTQITYEYDLPFLPSVVAPEASVLDKSVVFQFDGNDHVFTGIKFRQPEEEYVESEQQ